MRRETKAHMLTLINERLNDPDIRFFQDVAGPNMSLDEAICLVYGSLALTVTDKRALIWDNKVMHTI